jgi:hypothetical protein
LIFLFLISFIFSVVVLLNAVIVIPSHRCHSHCRALLLWQWQWLCAWQWLLRCAWQWLLLLLLLCAWQWQWLWQWLRGIEPLGLGQPGVGGGVPGRPVRKRIQKERGGKESRIFTRGSAFFWLNLVKKRC